MQDGLPSEYANTNRALGHDYNCAYAAGGDCYCRVYAQAVAAGLRDARNTYREMGMISGMVNADFKPLVVAVAAFFNEDESGGYDDDIPARMADAATIVGSCHFLANSTSSVHTTPMCALMAAVDTMQADITKKGGGRVSGFGLAWTLRKAVEAALNNGESVYEAMTKFYGGTPADGVSWD